jgi:hypothetical protein
MQPVASIPQAILFCNRFLEECAHWSMSDDRAAQSMEVLGDRWSIVVRDSMFGNRRHFAIFSRIPMSAWYKSVKRVNANHRLRWFCPEPPRKPHQVAKRPTAMELPQGWEVAQSPLPRRRDLSQQAIACCRFRGVASCGYRNLAVSMDRLRSKTKSCPIMNCFFGGRTACKARNTIRGIISSQLGCGNPCTLQAEGRPDSTSLAGASPEIA